MSANIHISLSAEPIFTIAGFTFTNSVFTSLIISTLLISFAIFVRFNLKKTNEPSGVQNFIEMVIEGFYGMIQSMTNDTKKTKTFLPFIASFFLFIILNNYFGLLPGVGTIGISEKQIKKVEIVSPLITQVEAVTHEEIQVKKEFANQDQTDQHSEAVELETLDVHQDTSLEGEHASEHASFVPIFRAGTADLNTTIALAIVSVFLNQFFGFKFLQFGYLKKFFNFSNPINFYVGILELISEFAKIVSFAFRLFGNIFAGEVLLAVIGFLIPIILPMPFYGLELFVGFIQALVFSMLSLLFFNIATQSHDQH